MALYKVLVQSFIDGRLYDPGEQVEYGGDRVGPNLAYISGKKPKDAYASDEIGNIDPASVPDTPSGISPTISTPVAPGSDGKPVPPTSPSLSAS